MEIFNHYIESSLSAYPETRVPEQAFDMLLQMSKGYPMATARDQYGRVVGFALLRAHNPMPVFSRTAEAAYFIHPDHTGKGLGRSLLEHLEQGASEKGITTILASISSLNPGSVNFHLKNGFIECGRFRNVGMKMGREFDTVWMQKML
jgi:phosphinothricin acetyltransferase